jgi:hypothetical protein
LITDIRCGKFETSLLPCFSSRAQIRTPVRPAGDFFLLFRGEMCFAFLFSPFSSSSPIYQRRPVMRGDHPGSSGTWTNRGFCHSGRNLVSAKNDLAPPPRDFRSRRQPRFVRHVEATTPVRPARRGDDPGSPGTSLDPKTRPLGRAGPSCR